jgi:hypothetical protein
VATPTCVTINQSDYQMDVRVHRTRMTPIERIDADLFGFIRLPGARWRMERGERCF